MIRKLIFAIALHFSFDPEKVLEKAAAVGVPVTLGRATFDWFGTSYYKLVISTPAGKRYLQVEKVGPDKQGNSRPRHYNAEKEVGTLAQKLFESFSSKLPLELDQRTLIIAN
jgi:hypothetical protein